MPLILRIPANRSRIKSNSSRYSDKSHQHQKSECRLKPHQTSAWKGDITATRQPERPGHKRIRIQFKRLHHMTGRFGKTRTLYDMVKDRLNALSPAEFDMVIPDKICQQCRHQQTQTTASKCSNDPWLHFLGNNINNNGYT